MFSHLDSCGVPLSQDRLVLWNMRRNEILQHDSRTRNVHIAMAAPILVGLSRASQRRNEHRQSVTGLRPDGIGESRRILRNEATDSSAHTWEV